MGIGNTEYRRAGRGLRDGGLRRVAAESKAEATAESEAWRPGEAILLSQDDARAKPAVDRRLGQERVRASRSRRAGLTPTG